MKTRPHYEVPDLFNLLPVVAAGLIWRMDDNILFFTNSLTIVGVSSRMPTYFQTMAAKLLKSA